MAVWDRCGSRTVTPMFEPFPSTYRTHASVPARKQAHSTAHPHGLPSKKDSTEESFLFVAQVILSI